MMDLMKSSNGVDQSVSQINHHLPLTVIPLINSSLSNPIRFTVGPAQFGRQLHGQLGVRNK